MENMEKNEEATPKMITVEQANEQVQKVIDKANEQIGQMASQIEMLNSMLKDKTVEQMFKVLEYSQFFTTDFVTNCSEVLEKFLTRVAINPPVEDQPTEKNKEEIKEE